MNRKIINSIANKRKGDRNSRANLTHQDSSIKSPIRSENIDDDDEKLSQVLKPKKVKFPLSIASYRLSSPNNVGVGRSVQASSKSDLF